MHESSASPTHPPMTDDAALERTIGELLSEAVRRQFWMLFVLPDLTLAPVILPTDLPADPHETVDTDEGPLTHAGAVARMVDRLVAEFGFEAALFVWERPGRGRIARDEHEWARALADACRGRGVRIRAQLLLSDAGVRVLTPDDLAPFSAV